MFIAGKKYRKRMAKKNKEILKLLKYTCPLCNKNIRARTYSLVYKWRIREKITTEEAINILKESHYRHIHTNYDSRVDIIYNDLLSIGYTHRYAKIQSKKIARSEIRDTIYELMKL